LELKREHVKMRRERRPYRMALNWSGISMRAASAKLGSGKRVLVTLWKSTN
jgi:hypothetical protein